MTTSFKWPLAVPSFSFLDKLKVAGWMLTQDRYTMGAKTEELEARFSEFAGAHALMLSSGSAANQMIFELWKLKNHGETPIVIVPAVTWISSITPAMMAGCDIAFCDVNVVDFSFDYGMLERMLKSYEGRRIIIWPTALIGFSPDMLTLKSLAARYKADLYLDACENTFSDGILASAPITTTSCYMSHQVVSIEGGFCFFEDEDDFKLAKMFRNHGLSRSLAPNDTTRLIIEAENPDVDPAFLFALPGTNMRPTDVHAAFGLLDFKRIDKARAHREAIYEAFVATLDPVEYYVPTHPLHSAFCLPIFRRDGRVGCVKHELRLKGIETRPIIGGNLLRQPVFKAYGEPSSFPNAEWIHTHGCYVGLHAKVTEQMVHELGATLNPIGSK